VYQQGKEMTDMSGPKRERRFVWAVAPGGSPSDEAEAKDALRWLGRRLAFEQWFDDLRGDRRPVRKTQQA
jgi:hypothetical protein